MFQVDLSEGPTFTNTAKACFNGIVIGLVMIKFVEVVSGKRLTP